MKPWRWWFLRPTKPVFSSFRKRFSGLGRTAGPDVCGRNRTGERGSPWFNRKSDGLNSKSWQVYGCSFISVIVCCCFFQMESTYLRNTSKYRHHNWWANTSVASSWLTVFPEIRCFCIRHAGPCRGACDDTRGADWGGWQGDPAPKRSRNTSIPLFTHFSPIPHVLKRTSIVHPCSMSLY